MRLRATDRPVRVAVVSHDWSTTTGAGRCAVELLDALHGRSGVVVVVGPDDLPERRRGQLSIAAKLYRSLQVFRVLRSRRVDVVVVNTTIQASVVAAARLAGIRVIWWCHESGVALHGPLMRLRLTVYRLLSHEMVAVSRAVPRTRGSRRTIRNVTEDSGNTTPSSITGGSTLLVLGTKSFTKGTDRIPALVDPELLPGSPRLEVVGWEDPRDEEMLATTLSSLERAWGDRLTWRGPVEEPDEVYATAAVLLLPSRADSRPRVVEEALERGIPVVASHLPGLVEIGESVTDSQALTLLPLDSSWTAAVAAALTSGRTPHARISLFSRKQFAQAWVDVIMDVVADRGSSQSG